MPNQGSEPPHSAHRRRALAWLGASAAAALAGCAGLPQPAGEADGGEAALADSAWAQASQLVPGARWEHHVFPQRRITHYRAGQHVGRPALRAESDAGTSAVRMRLRVPVSEIAALRWSWWVDELDPAFDPSDRDTDDAVARVILAFEGGREHWTARDHHLSELARLVTGEPLPDATLMYVWDARLPLGTVVRHPGTGRIRTLIVASGAHDLGRWLELERDPLADMRLAFGETPTTLVAVGLMTDANNTRSRAAAWYGPLELVRRGRGG
ncbi:DUF3047 domain-containing protein [Tepidimonas sp.]|uniref:DUF3047 domain-containing protein n=1 Tax=Tepidimonas sp. TaxID=2002775 RepID=UPI002FE2A80E